MWQAGPVPRTNTRPSDRSGPLVHALASQALRTGLEYIHWTRISQKTLSNILSYRYTVVFCPFPLDRFQLRKHPESDRNPKPRAAGRKHAPARVTVPRSRLPFVHAVTTTMLSTHLPGRGSLRAAVAPSSHHRVAERQRSRVQGEARLGMLVADAAVRQPGSPGGWYGGNTLVARPSRQLAQCRNRTRPMP